MDKRLDLYLQTVERELGGLETEQREGELREMRQHIEAIVTRLVEGGLNESEAIEAAIAQFGAARQIGRELQTARAGRESLGRVMLAVLGAGVVYIGFGSLSPMLFQSAQGTIGVAVWLIPLVVAALVSFGAGAFAGFIAPYQGARATLWTFGVINMVVFTTLQLMGAGNHFGIYVWLACMASLAVQLLVMAQGAVFGARYTQYQRLMRV